MQIHRRVQVTKTSGGLKNYPIYSLDGKLLVEDNRQTLKRTEYIYAGGRLVAKKIQPITSGGANSGTATTTYIHTDFLGSPVAETDSAGTVTRVERYTPYGEPSDMQLDVGPGFTGHATDVLTGLTYMQQRYYDAEIGRFISPDPVGPEEDFVKHFNRYVYAYDNPVRYTDPDGTIAELHWTANNAVTQTVSWTMSGVKPGFTPEQVNAQIAKDFSGTAMINGITVSVTAVGIYMEIAEGANYNTVGVIEDTEGYTESNNSQTNKIGGDTIVAGATGKEAATAKTMSHELGGHASGAGDQYNGGIDVNGNALTADVPGSPNVMKDLTGMPSNEQTRTEIIMAPTNVNTCAPGVHAANGGC